MPPGLIRKQALKTQCWTETWRLYEKWPWAPCTNYCHLVWDNVNFFLLC